MERILREFENFLNENDEDYCCDEIFEFLASFSRGEIYSFLLESLHKYQQEKLNNQK